MPDVSSDIQHSTVLSSLMHTAVTGTADVNSGNGFISDHIISLTLPFPNFTREVEPTPQFSQKQFPP